MKKCELAVLSTVNVKENNGRKKWCPLFDTASSLGAARLWLRNNNTSSNVCSDDSTTPLTRHCTLPFQLRSISYILTCYRSVIWISCLHGPTGICLVYVDLSLNLVKNGFYSEDGCSSLFQLPSFCHGLNLCASFFMVLRGMIPIYEIYEGLNTITQPLT